MGEIKIQHQFLKFSLKLLAVPSGSSSQPHSFIGVVLGSSVTSTGLEIEELEFESV